MKPLILCIVGQTNILKFLFFIFQQRLSQYTYNGAVPFNTLKYIVIQLLAFLEIKRPKLWCILFGFNIYVHTYQVEHPVDRRRQIHFRDRWICSAERK